MQNSLDRIFEGLERALREIVAPAVDDPYVLAQVTSIAEIVGNLSTRVEWRCDQLLEVCERVRPVLEQAMARDPQGLDLTRRVLSGAPPGAGWPNAALVQARHDHLRALGEVQRSLESRPDDDLERAVRDLLGWQVEREAQLLRTGMFSDRGR